MASRLGSDCSQVAIGMPAEGNCVVGIRQMSKGATSYRYIDIMTRSGPGGQAEVRCYVSQSYQAKDGGHEWRVGVLAVGLKSCHIAQRWPFYTVAVTACTRRTPNELLLRAETRREGASDALVGWTVTVSVCVCVCGGGAVNGTVCLPPRQESRPPACC